MIYQLSQFFSLFFFRETGEKLATKEYQDFQRLSVNFRFIRTLPKIFEDIRRFPKIRDDVRINLNAFIDFKMVIPL